MIKGERLAELRKDSGLRQEDLATEIGVTDRTISSWETEKVAPPDEMKIELAKKFNISLDYLLGITDEALLLNRDNVIVLPRNFSPEMKKDMLFLYEMVLIKYGFKNFVKTTE